MTIDTTPQDFLDTTDEGGEPWRAAGDAWSHAATDWAYLFEPHARDAVEAVIGLTEIGSGSRVLDVACGAGYATSRIARVGATVSGIDVATGLIEIAERRTPRGEFVCGDMFNLPWPDDCFDAVVAFNGVWGGCERAVLEMARVCRPGGHIGLTYWGSADRLDLLSYFMTIATSAPRVSEEIAELAAINQPGVADTILSNAGFTDLIFGTTNGVLEFVDEAAAWRALRSPGLIVPAIECTGEAALRRHVLDSISNSRSDDGTYRLVNELVHVVGRLEA